MRSLARYRSFFAVVFAFLLSAGLVWAALQNQPLLKVTRTDDSNFLNEISVNVDDDGNLVTMGVSLEKSPVTLPQLQKGFVLNRTSGIETVRLTAGNGFNVKSGGPLTMRYLKQFKLIGSSEYGEFNMVLVKEGGRWLLRDDHHQDFNQLRMTAGSRGISDVSAVNASASQKVQAWINESLLPAWDRDRESDAVYSRGLNSGTRKEGGGSLNRVPAPPPKRDSEADSAF
jgi:hypothetical protein